MLKLSDYRYQNDVLRMTRHLISKEVAQLKQAQKLLHAQKNYSEDEYFQGCFDTYNDILEKISIIKTPIHKLR